MSAFTHLLNIGTLAAWLSVAGFGTVAFFFPGNPVRMPRMVVNETKVLPDDFELGGESSPESADQEPEADSPSIAEPLPAPPDLPEIAETEPLPAVPAFPAIAENPAPAAIPETRPATRKGPSSSETSRPASRKPSTTGATGSGQSRAGSSGMSTAARIAAGRMPSPSYPAEARRKGQTGTVTVEFTVDTSGRVIAAYAKSPSPWPLLNEEAVRTVRRWRFPPGGVMKLQRPIIFQLR